MLKNDVLKKSSFIIKIAIVTATLGGVVLSLFYAEIDGYSHWATRLMYFTGLSNLWIGVSVFLLIIAPYTRKLSTDVWIKRLYVLRYIFVVSITVTCFVYCVLLAPFAEQGNFNPWTFSNVLTHVIAPIFAVADFFIDEYKFKIKKEHIIFTAVPPAVYFVFAGILNIFDVDFGRGDTYPYFFLNPETQGVAGVVKWVGILFAGFIALGYIFYGIDKTIKSKK